MSNMTGEERANRLLDKVFNRPTPVVALTESTPNEPKSSILRSLNRQRRRLEDMRKGL